jgi:5-oxoprolinase (ATP-hydrolysing) subunit A
VDLNADMAEGDRWTGRDRVLLDTVTSASIACGFHAGNRSVMRAAAAACVERGVAIGAHFSYRDRIGFGRRDRAVATDRLTADVLEQWATLVDESAGVGGTVAYAKPHGALYHRMAVDAEVAAAVIEALAPHCTMLVAPPGSAVDMPAREAGLRLVPEGFPDRAYDEDGRLSPRDLPDAVIDDEAAVAVRALTLVQRGGITTRDGRWIELGVETLCIHGDSPRAGAAARAVRETLERAGLTVRAFAVPPDE